MRRGRAALRGKPWDIHDNVYVTKPKRRASEEAFHCQVARFLDQALPEGYFWTTFPSGGGGKIRGAKLKRMGLKPGIPDIVLFGERQYPVVLWLELKAKRGALSQAQKDMHEALRGLGHRVAVVRTLEEVEAVLAAEYYYPLRARVR